MASDAFTNNPGRSGETASAATIEFNLLIEDHLALSLYAYDTARAARRGVGGYFAGVCGLAMMVLILTLMVLENERWRSILSDSLLGLLGLYLLLYLNPGRLFAGFRRSFYQGRITRLIRDNQRVGLYNSKRQDRVVMMADCFIEINDLHDTSASGVSLIEHRETRVQWSAVARIDVPGEHAIFTVVDGGYVRGYLILPRRVFADEAAFLAFVEKAKSYHETAHRALAPVAEPFTSPDTRITDEFFG